MAKDIRDFAALKFANKAEARAWLFNRYAEQVAQFPRLARFTAESYVRRNLAAAMRMTVEVVA